MMLLLFPQTKCSYILTLCNQIHEDFSKYAATAIFFFLIFTGLFISLLGVNNLSTSLFLLLLIAIEVFFVNLREYIKKAGDAGKSQYWEGIQNFANKIDQSIENNLKLVAISMLFICLVLSYLLVACFKAISLFGFVIVALYVYSEGFHIKASIRLGITNQYVLWFLFFLFVVGLWFLFRKMPYFVLAIFFGFIGPLITVCCIETLFDVDWGFNRMRNEKNMPKVESDNMYHLTSFLIICAIVSCYQIFIVLKK